MKTSNFKIWVEAARPHTLPAAVVPVMVGASLAAYDGQLYWPATITALFCALLIQVGTNFANDYFDFIKGADTDDRIGFERATAKGLVSTRQMRNATFITMSVAFLAGLYLVWIAGWIILAVGLASLLFGILYTGGPWPLAYNGLGDLFVFIFFGLIAVMGTYYVNALEWSAASFWASLAIGGLCTNILVVNNLRDIEEDAKAGKKTLGVLLGGDALRWEYTLMLFLAFAVPPHLYYRLDFGWTVLLPFVSVPGAAILLKVIWTETDKRRFNRFLTRTARFMLLFAVLFSVGILLSP